MSRFASRAELLDVAGSPEAGSGGKVSTDRVDGDHQFMHRSLLFCSPAFHVLGAHILLLASNSIARARFVWASCTGEFLIADKHDAWRLEYVVRACPYRYVLAYSKMLTCRAVRLLFSRSSGVLWCPACPLQSF